MPLLTCPRVLTCAHASCLMTCPVRPFPSHTLPRFVLCSLSLRLCEDRKQCTCMRVRKRVNISKCPHFKVKCSKLNSICGGFESIRTTGRPRVLGNSERRWRRPRAQAPKAGVRAIRQTWGRPDAEKSQEKRDLCFSKNSKSPQFMQPCPPLAPVLRLFKAARELSRQSSFFCARHRPERPQSADALPLCNVRPI